MHLNAQIIASEKDYYLGRRVGSDFEPSTREIFSIFLGRLIDDRDRSMRIVHALPISCGLPYLLCRVEIRKPAKRALDRPAYGGEKRHYIFQENL